MIGPHRGEDLEGVGVLAGLRTEEHHEVGDGEAGAVVVECFRCAREFGDEDGEAGNTSGRVEEGGEGVELLMPLGK